MEAERRWIMMLALTLLLFAPFSILVGGFLTFAAFLTPSLDWKNPLTYLAAFTFLLYFILPFFWVYVGVRQLRFVRKWNRRSIRLREIERELEHEFRIDAPIPKRD